MHAATAPSSARPSRFVDDIIRQRAATDFFDPTFVLGDDDILGLADLATRAPSAYNLQNWHLHAVRTPEMKARMRAAAFGQAKVEEAAVTFVVSGELPRGDELTDRLAPAVEAGAICAATAVAWVAQARASYKDGQKARDEAIRSATLLASTLMFASEAYGLSTAPMSGFDADAVRSLLGLPAELLPVMLVGIGAPLPGNALQKPRRSLSEVLDLA